MGRLRATGTLRSHGPGTWTVLALDRRVSAGLGARGKVRVAGTLNGTPFETTAVPNGDGTHSLLVTRPIQVAASVGPGDRVEVTFGPSAGPRPIRPPAPLARALRETAEARRRFAALAPSHRRAWSEYVASAKLPGTQERRARTAVARLLAGARRPDDRDGGS